MLINVLQLPSICSSASSPPLPTTRLKIIPAWHSDLDSTDRDVQPFNDQMKFHLHSTIVYFLCKSNRTLLQVTSASFFGIARASSHFSFAHRSSQWKYFTAADCNHLLIALHSLLVCLFLRVRFGESWWTGNSSLQVGTVQRLESRLYLIRASSVQEPQSSRSHSLIEQLHTDVPSRLCIHTSNCFV